jgi:hypothetical protein
MSATRAEELIEEFDWYEGALKRREMEEALSLREEITPLLLRILEAVAADPGQYVEEDHDAHLYAVALLAHFEEPAAHLPIIRAFRIPEEQRERLWGDMVTETLPILLLQTCNGRLAAIMELIGDREAPLYVRGAAVETLTYAVAREMISREEVVAFLSSLFTGAEAEPDSSFWSNVACAISDLHPEGAMEEIRKAFTEELIDPGYVGLAEIEWDLARDPAEVLAELRNQTERRIPRDVHTYLSWLDCFQEKQPLPPRLVDRSVTAQQKRKKKNRVRSKLAKKARKKNKR